MKCYDLRIEVDGNDNVLQITDRSVHGVIRILKLPALIWRNETVNMLEGGEEPQVSELTDILDRIHKLEKRINILEASKSNQAWNPIFTRDE